MPEPQIVNSNRMEGKLAGHQADNLMKKAMTSRLHDRLAQIDNHRASFRRHLSRAKKSDTTSGLSLSLGPDISIRKTPRKEAKSRRRVVNFALPVTNHQWQRGNGSDVTFVRQTKSSGYGSDAERLNASGNSSAISARDDPHLAVPPSRTGIAQDGGERGKDGASRSGGSSNGCEGLEREEIGEEEIRGVSATFNGLDLLGELEERTQSGSKKRQGHRIDREKTFAGKCIFPLSYLCYFSSQF